MTGAYSGNSSGYIWSLSKLWVLFVAGVLGCFSGYAEPSSLHASLDKNAKEVFVQARGAQLFCRVFGLGDPIIVIHGGPGLSQDYLLPQMVQLARTHCVIFYDQRGCGRSTGEISSDTMQIAPFVEDIEAIRIWFGYKQITILGHSWGGFLAMQYAFIHPEAIDRLVLLNTSPPSSEEQSSVIQEWTRRLAPYEDQLQAIQKSSAFAEGDPASIEKYYRIIFARYCCNPQCADLLNLCLNRNAAMNGFKVLELFEQDLFAKPYNFYPSLKQLKMPTLIIHGDCDVIAPSIAQKIHEAISGSQYILIKKCGHFPYVEAPEKLFFYLNEFLSSKSKLSPEQTIELREKVEQGIPKAKVAKQFGISRETVYQHLNKPTSF